MSLTDMATGRALDERRTAHPLEALYEREYRSLVRLASILLDDRGASEEVVQDAFVRALLAWHTLRDDSKAAPFLRSAVLNGARSRLRHRRVVSRHPQPPPPSEDPARDSAIVDRHVVIAGIRGLPDRQRDCVVLRYYLDLSEADIAATLGVSPGSVKTHLHRGLATLARRLEEKA